MPDTMTETAPGRYERVLIVTDFHDRPRAGIADFEGKPHAFACIFDEIEDEYSSLFRLKPVDTQVVRLALEQQAIWLRWQDAFRRGKTDLKTHPALPPDRERYERIQLVLKPALEIAQDTTLRATGTFRSREEAPNEWVSEVLWRGAD